MSLRVGRLFGSLSWERQRGQVVVLDVQNTERSGGVATPAEANAVQVVVAGDQSLESMVGAKTVQSSQIVAGNVEMLDSVVHLSSKIQRGDVVGTNENGRVVLVLGGDYLMVTIVVAKNFGSVASCVVACCLHCFRKDGVDRIDGIDGGIGGSGGGGEPGGTQECG